MFTFESPELKGVVFKNGKFNYPSWGLSIGWLTAISSMSMVPFFALRIYCK